MTSPRQLRDTERRNPRSTAIDTLGATELVELFCAEDKLVPTAVASAAREITEAVQFVEQAFRSGGRLFYVGAGTSGRLGVLDASECPPTFGTDPEQVQGIIAGGNAALTNSIEGAEDDPAGGAAALVERGISERDVVVGIAASGSTPFVLGALRHASSCGATTIFLTCASPDPDIQGQTDLVIQVDVGPEVITGSTRLKAGTATKLVLNMITTGALIRTGKTYGNLMVDLQARNSKLHDRGERIVMEVLAVDRDTARQAIDAADGSVRTAIAMQFLGVDSAEAERRIGEVNGRLRMLIGDPPPTSTDE
jgi:N-acetylmuramic acid 6-phosphate etherase